MHLKQESPPNVLQKELCSIKDHLKCLNNYEPLKEIQFVWWILESNHDSNQIKESCDFFGS